jgi:hypothetical protein
MTTEDNTSKEVIKDSDEALNGSDDDIEVEVE